MRKFLLLCMVVFAIMTIHAQESPAKKFPAGKKEKTDLSIERSKSITSSGKEATKVQSNFAKGVLLFENTNIVTHPGQGAGGADYSWSWDDNSWGMSVSLVNDFSIAVNFEVLDASWTIDSIRLYAYQTGSTTTSTLNDVRIQIWEGYPGQPGSTIVWGDLTTNRLASTRYTNCYRGTDFTNTQRPIMVAVCNTPSLSLTQGLNYWAEYTMGGTLTSGPWVPPIAAGSDLQNDGTTYNNSGHEFPLDIFGDAVPTSCITVSNISIDSIEDISANISWTENGTATSWLIEYGTPGFAQGSGTTVLANNNPYTLTGLTPNTNYEVFIRAFCAVGDTSIYSSSVSFSTINCPTSALCEYEFILTDEYGDGWNGAAIEVYESGILKEVVTLATGSALTKSVLLCGGSTIELKWISGSYDEECALIINDPYGATIFSFGFNASPTAGATFHTFTADCSSSCFPPTGLTASSITLASAELDWTDNASTTTWDIEWGAAPFTQGNGTLVSGTSTKPYSLTGLTAATTYSFYVRAICDTTFSNWAGPYTFNTLCDAITAFPWTESFEGTAFPPVCWNNIDADGDSYMWEQRTTWNAQHGSAVAVSGSWFSGVALNPDNYLVTPPLEISNSNLELSFWVAAQDIDFPAEKYSIMVSTTGYNEVDFTNSIHTETLSDTTFKKVTLSLSNFVGETIYIAFRHWDSYDLFFMKIDNVSVGLPTGIDNIKTNSNLTVFPNPTREVLNIKSSEVIKNVKVINALGQTVANEIIESKQHTINTSNYNYGMYFLQIETTEGIFNERVIIAQ